MAFFLVLYYRPLLWSFIMVLYYGPLLWSLTIVLYYGPLLWSFTMVLYYGALLCFPAKYSGAEIITHSPKILATWIWLILN